MFQELERSKKLAALQDSFSGSAFMKTVSHPTHGLHTAMTSRLEKHTSISELFHANRNWRDGNNLNVSAVPSIVCNQNQYQLFFQKPVLGLARLVVRGETQVISAQKLVGERRLRRQAWMAEDAWKSHLRMLGVRASDRDYSFDSMMKPGQQEINGKIVEPTDAVATNSESRIGTEKRKLSEPTNFSRGPDMICSARSEIQSFTADELSDDPLQESVLETPLKLWPTKSFESSSSARSIPLHGSEANSSDEDEEETDFSEFWN